MVEQVAAQQAQVDIVRHRLREAQRRAVARLEPAGRAATRHDVEDAWLVLQVAEATLDALRAELSAASVVPLALPSSAQHSPAPVHGSASGTAYPSPWTRPR